MSTGFVSKSEQPTSTLLARSLARAWAVKAMIGILDVTGLALINCVASQPSISPSATSIRIKSGISLAAMATPAAPSWAEQTEKPWRCSRRVSMSRFISLSSTSKILCMGGFRGGVQGVLVGFRHQRGSAVGVRLAPARGHRHPYGEAASLSEFALYDNFATHQLAQLLTERQAESCPTVLAGAGIVCDGKFLEKMRNLRGRNADAVVYHVDHELIAGIGCRSGSDELDSSALGELRRVVEQLSDHALEPACITKGKTEIRSQ